MIRPPLSSHPTTTRRGALGLGVMSVAAGALSACGESASSTNRPTGAKPSEGYPRTVQGALGSVVIESAPERVLAASERIELEALLAAGVQPMAYFHHMSYGVDLPEWTRSRLDSSVEELSVTAELDIERMVAQNADLIVSSPYLVESHYGELVDLVPVVTLNDFGPDEAWLDALRLVASAVGAEEAAAEHERALRKNVGEMRASLSEIRDLEVATLYGYNGSIGQEAGGSGTRAIFDLLGIRQPGRLRAEEGFSVELSMETIDEAADADVLLITDWSSTPGDETTDELFASPLFQALPAVQEGRAVRIPLQETIGAYMLTALSLEPVAEVFRDAVLRAHAGDGDLSA